MHNISILRVKLSMAPRQYLHRGRLPSEEEENEEGTDHA